MLDRDKMRLIPIGKLDVWEVGNRRDIGTYLTQRMCIQTFDIEMLNRIQTKYLIPQLIETERLQTETR